MSSNASQAVLVTGGTGAVGSAVLRALLARGVAVRALVRDPGRAAAALGDEVELAVGDLTDKRSIDAALDGVDRVFLCSANRPDQVQLERNVIDAVAARRVRLLVKVGANGAEIGSPVHFWDAHGRIEQHLRQSGVPSVVLHPTMYMSNLFAAAGSIAHLGRLFAPAGDAKVSLIDPIDVAAVASLVLTEDGHEGRTYLLTGPEAVTYHEVATQLSAALGRPVEYVDVPDQAARDSMVLAGVPEWLAEQILVLWSQLRLGAGATVTDVVLALTGREPRPVADFARHHAAAFQP